MLRYLFVLSCLVMFHGCSDRAERERLAQQNSELKEEARILKEQLQASREKADRWDFLSSKMKGIKVRIVTDYGNIEVAFFPEKAPLHCFNFLARAESGFFENTQFHRVVPGFVIQGGDPNTKDGDPYNDGLGGPIVAIPHELNDTLHRRGILSMARVADKSAGAGTQFFIMHADNFSLNGEYTAFGEVIQGMDVVDRIANVETYHRDPLKEHPVKPVVIRKVEVFR